MVLDRTRRAVGCACHGWTAQKPFKQHRKSRPSFRRLRSICNLAPRSIYIHGGGGGDGQEDVGDQISPLQLQPLALIRHATQPPQPQVDQHGGLRSRRLRVARARRPQPAELLRRRAEQHGVLPAARHQERQGHGGLGDLPPRQHRQASPEESAVHDAHGIRLHRYCCCREDRPESHARSLSTRLSSGHVVVRVPRSPPRPPPGRDHRHRLLGQAAVKNLRSCWCHAAVGPDGAAGRALGHERRRRRRGLLPRRAARPRAPGPSSPCDPLSSRPCSTGP